MEFEKWGAGLVGALIHGYSLGSLPISGPGSHRPPRPRALGYGKARVGLVMGQPLACIEAPGSVSRDGNAKVTKARQWECGKMGVTLEL